MPNVKCKYIEDKDGIFIVHGEVMWYTPKVSFEGKGAIYTKQCI